VSVRSRTKLIEVALPLGAINKACASEKSIRHGHPSTLHLWWARRPLAAARSVIFAQMVDDPSDVPEEFPTEAEQEAERKRLFELIEQLVLWENTTNQEVLEAAREEIRRSWRRACADNADHPDAKQLFDPEVLPSFHDPFAGGGALPLEAQRLGLESYASDLNPVAVLINKAMIEIPPKFAAQPPVNPEAREEGGEMFGREWTGAQGLAEDVRYYGQWMREQAERRIGHLYPKVMITAEMAQERPDLKKYVGTELTVIAWLWARTVKSPNPAFANVEVPLVSNFMLSTKKGKEAYVEPIIEAGSYSFKVRVGAPSDPEAATAGTKLGRGANFRCLLSATPIDGDHIKAQGVAGEMSSTLMAVVAAGERGRVYLDGTEEMEAVASSKQPEWRPAVDIPHDPRNFWTPPYGLTTYGDLFTDRQLVALTTFSDLISEAREQILTDARQVSDSNDPTPLRGGGAGPEAYAEAVSVYLSIAVDKAVDYNSAGCSWISGGQTMRNTFGRQAIPMVWDFAEANTLSLTTGGFHSAVDQVKKAIATLPCALSGSAFQSDAGVQEESAGRVVSTDPPYYDNIGYADLSDYFYVWMRRSISSIYPDLFATVAVPKADELVACPYRHGGREKAEEFFLEGMTIAMRRICVAASPAFPVTIYYAFKQSETSDAEGTTNTGWDTFLEAVVEAGFAVTGTWPMRTERTNRMISFGTNALASSIVLVCRPRVIDAEVATRRQFLTALKSELPETLLHLQHGNIAPVDLAQASIGPGMAIYTRYAKVLDADGEPLSVRAALALINQVLDEALAEQEGDLDPDSRWAVVWFETNGFGEGDFGVANQLAQAKNTSVNGVSQAGLLDAKGGKVRLLRPSELPDEWDPRDDGRLTVWESVHHLVRALDSGEAEAAELVRRLGGSAGLARELAYRLYVICERKGWAQEAISYNSLVQSWPELLRLAAAPSGGDQQQRLEVGNG